MTRYSKALRFFADDKSGERFWASVERREPGECWLWKGARDKDNYGIFKPRPFFRVTASRFAFVLATGIEPSSRQVCHTCDNPPCCNPDHLFLGTPKMNMEDKVQKGRARGRFSAKVQNDASAPVFDRVTEFPETKEIRQC